MNSDEKRTRKRATLGKLLNESFFVYILTAVADFFLNAIENSNFARIFTGYENVEKLYEESFVGRNLKKMFSFPKELHRLKTNAAKACENSVILTRLRSGTLGLLQKPMRYYGSGLMYFGLYVSILHVVKYLAIMGADFDVSYIYTGIACLAAGIMLMASKKSAAGAVSESVILRAVLAVIDVDVRMLPHKSSKATSHASAIAVGTVLGLMSLAVHPLILIAGILALIGISLILYSPETGMIVIFTAVPFLPTMVLAGLVILTAFSFFYKAIRGKRSFRIEFFDVLVLCFAVIVLFGGLISLGGRGSLPPALMFICFMSAYFLAVNLIRSETLLTKCVVRMLAALAAVSVYGIYQNFFGTTTAAWLDSTMFTEIGNRVVSTFENPNVLGQYLIIMLPFAILAMLEERGRARLGAIAVTALTAICLVFTWSRGAWLGAIFGVLIMLMIYSRHTMKVCVAGLFALPLLPFVVPDTILNRFMSIGNLGDSSTMYRVNIWKGTLRMTGDYFIGGIGMGEAAFRKVYPNYSLEAIEAAPHSHNLFLQVLTENGIFGMLFLVILFYFFIKLCTDFVTDKSRYDGSKCSVVCLAGFGGILSVLLQSFTDYVWYNYRFFLFFWLVISLCVAARKIRISEEIAKKAEMQ